MTAAVTGRVADAAARALRDLGVKRVYGLPGEDHMELLDAIAGAGIDYVFARSESAACIMAGLEADATGRPAVVIVSMAPGLTNAINGIANAFLDKLPLIVITGQHDRARLPLTIRQVMDSHEVVRGVTKWRATAGNAIRQLLVKAFDVAATPPAGPVYLEISSELAAGDAREETRWMLPERERLVSTTASTEATAAIGRWHRAVLAADRPVAIVGHAARSAEIAAPLRDLARALRIPVLTTPSAKGILPDDDAWSAGTFVGGNLEARMLERSDLLITFGLDGNDYLNRHWPYAAPILSFRAHGNAEGMLPIIAELTGHLPSILASFVGAGTRAASTWTTEDVRAYRAAVDAALAGPEALTVPRALRTLRELFPRDTLLAVDAGFGKAFTALLWRSYLPASYFSSHGLSTMGYAIPAANALKLLYPRRPVLGLMGDGSLLMRAGEIGVAAQLGLAPVFVVWMDNTMTQIAVKQARRGLRTVGTELAPVSCTSIAAAFGGTGYDVRSLDELALAAAAALKAQRPSLIGIHVDTSAARELFDLVRG